MSALSNPSPVAVTSPYIVSVLTQMPRLLSRMDRERPSKTFGSFDRTFWGWKFTDFSGSRFQEALYAMAWFYTTQAEGNIYYRNTRMLEWIVAGYDYWATLQHKDGSFDEAYPFERSLAAVSFTCFYLGEALIRLGDEFPVANRARILETFRKAGEWLCVNDEHHGVLSNHLAVAAAALDVISRLTDEEKFADRARYFINRILSCQSDEGWYEEYGGADFGYQTHGTFYLARYWQSTQDARLLDSLKKSVQFIWHFVHPNGTLGGEYASRNTSFFFPAGYEILAPVCPEAAAIANFMRGSVDVQAAAGLSMMDAYNFCPLLNNYLFAQDAMGFVPAPALPFEKAGHIDFPKAGLSVHSTPSYQAVFAPSKGGVVKIYDKKEATLAYSDCGYWIKHGAGRYSSQSFSLENKATYGAENAAVVAPFAKIKQKVMTPFLFIGFRIFMMTIGQQKNLALIVKDILVKILVRGRKIVDITLERKVQFAENSVTIVDVVTYGPDAPQGELIADGKFSTIHMGSARYYQPDELDFISPPSIHNNQRTFTWSAR